MPIVKIIGLNTGQRTALDGWYLIEYDPTIRGVDPAGHEMTAHILATPNRSEAREFTTAEVLSLYQRSHGLRPDGKPNRPLAAFHLSVEPR